MIKKSTMTELLDWDALSVDTLAMERLRVKSTISVDTEVKGHSQTLSDYVPNTIGEILVFTDLDVKRGNELTTLPRLRYLSRP